MKKCFAFHINVYKRLCLFLLVIALISLFSKVKGEVAMSIIIVDDNKTNQLIILHILKKEGYKDIITVSSANELYKLLKMDSAVTEEPFVDLILMDMMMPEIDGIEACREVKKLSHLQDIPVIFVTAMGNSNKMAEAMEAGAMDYVVKPIKKIELIARIRSALRFKFEKDRNKEREKHIKSELELAKQVQVSVLSQPIDDENITIDALYQPSYKVAGDFYAWYKISENRYGIIILDMMGHGVSSSLVCMFISSVIQDKIKNLSDPEQVITELNHYMNRLHMKDDLIQYYFTAIYLVIDTNEKTIQYVNAGHPPGLVFIDDQVEPLEQSSCAVGFFEKMDILKGQMKYKNSVQIVLFTDGLTEHLKKEGKQLKNTFEAFSYNFNLKDNEEDHEDDICIVRISTK